MGHLHSEQTSENGGIIFRNVSSMTGSDSWHISKGYIGAAQKAQIFIWSKKEGIDSIWYLPIVD